MTFLVDVGWSLRQSLHQLRTDAELPQSGVRQCGGCGGRLYRKRPQHRSAAMSAAVKIYKNPPTKVYRMLYKAYPTKYAGAMFRSRLEARWAVFFDLAKWKWSYKPVDYAGWVPDFLLHPDDGEPISVEVKPIEWPAHGDAYLAVFKERPDLAKVRAYKGGEALVLGSYILEAGTGRCLSDDGWATTGCALGVLWEAEGGYGADPAVIYGGTRGRVFDFAAMFGSYGYRIGGDADGDHHLEPVACSKVVRAWREAGNRMQWKGVGAKP
jgi:hypothetical protein